MATVSKAFLYFQVFAVGLLGATMMIAPQLVAPKLFLSALGIPGSSELRSLMGGGFIGFALVILGGLRCRRLAPGLLVAMTVIMAGIVVGRIASLVLDGYHVNALVAGISELAISAACWAVYRSNAPESERKN